jgi:hypothetical protein
MADQPAFPVGDSALSPKRETCPRARATSLPFAPPSAREQLPILFALVVRWQRQESRRMEGTAAKSRPTLSGGAHCLGRKNVRAARTAHDGLVKAASLDYPRRTARLLISSASKFIQHWCSRY